jgi:ferredoxin
MSLEIAIDPERCMGSGNCTFSAPDVFALDDSGIAVIVDPDAQTGDTIVAAARGCPTQAISITRDGEKVV